MGTTTQTNQDFATVINMDHDGEKFCANLDIEILKKLQSGQKLVFHCKLGDFNQALPIQLNALSNVYVNLDFETFAIDVDLGEKTETVFIDIVAKQAFVY